MIDNELEFDRLAEGGEKTFLSAKKKRMMVSFFKGSGSRDKTQTFVKNGHFYREFYVGLTRNLYWFKIEF